MRALMLMGVIVVVALVWWGSDAPRAPGDAEPLVVRPAGDDAPASGSPDVASPRASTPDAQPAPLALVGDDEPFVDVLLQLRAPGDDWRNPVPVADVRVELGVSERASRDDAWPVLARGVSDAEGLAALRVPWSALEPHVGDTQRHFAVRGARQGVLGLGLPPWTAALPDAPGAEVRLSVRVTLGVHADVLLLGPDGAPVAGRVTPYDATGGRTPSPWQRVDVGPDGRARVALHAEGPHRILGEGASRVHGRNAFDVADRFDLGNGASDEFDVRFDTQPAETIVVRVSGPGVLRGRVLGERDEPAHGLELSVYAEGWRGVGLRSRTLEQCARLFAGGGHLAWRGVTDAEGRFVLHGLRAERYTVHAELRDETGARSIPLSAQPLPADGREHALRLRRPHLVVRVVDTDGEPYAGELEQVRYGRGVVDDVWPQAPRLAVVPVAEHVDARDWVSPFLELNEVGPARFTAEVQPGRDYLVGLLQHGRAWAPQRVSVPEGAGGLDVELVVVPPGPTGTLQVEVLDPTGAPYHARVELRVVDAASAVGLLHLREVSSDASWPLSWELPPGRYHLRVDARPATDMHHGTLWDERELGGFEQTVELRAHDVTPVVARLGAGARVQLVVRGAADASDRAAVLAEAPALTDDPELLEELAARVELQLQRPGRWPLPLEFARHAYQGSSAEGTHLLSWIDLGSSETSTRLAAGAHTLVARLPGGRELRRELELIDGVTTEVVLEFR